MAPEDPQKKALLIDVNPKIDKMVNLYAKDYKITVQEIKYKPDMFKNDIEGYLTYVYLEHKKKLNLKPIKNLKSGTKE